MKADLPKPDRRLETVTLLLDGRPVEVRAGLNLAAALLSVGVRTLRYSPQAKAPRGAFCFMGACQECVVSVDGRRVRACLEPVRERMEIGLESGDDH